MATKKQKRAAALAKHEEFMAELKRSNQENLKRVQVQRERKRLEEEQARDNRVEANRKESLKAINEMAREIDILDDSSLEMECI